MRFRWLRTRHVPCCKWSIAVDALTGCICSEAVWVSLNWPCTNQGFKKSPLIARLIREYMERGHNNAVGRRDDESVHATGKR
jgi:hypothetical protein